MLIELHKQGMVKSLFVCTEGAFVGVAEVQPGNPDKAIPNEAIPNEAITDKAAPMRPHNQGHPY